MAYAVDDDRGGLGERTVALFRSHTTALWVVTLAGFVGGDLVTTAVGLSGGSVVEVGPLAARFVGQFGLGAMLPLKLLAVGICVVLWRLTPEPHDVGVPLGLATFGILVTVWNCYVLVLAYGLPPL